jgi:hypothetical protein
MDGPYLARTSVVRVEGEHPWRSRVLAIDVAKHVFQLREIERCGRPMYNRWCTGASQVSWQNMVRLRGSLFVAG